MVITFSWVAEEIGAFGCAFSACAEIPRRNDTVQRV
jgi:hypothetical protein